MADVQVGGWVGGWQQRLGGLEGRTACPKINKQARSKLMLLLLLRA